MTKREYELLRKLEKGPIRGNELTKREKRTALKLIRKGLAEISPDGNAEEGKQGSEPTGNGFGIGSGDRADQCTKKVAKQAKKKLRPGAYRSPALELLLHCLLAALLGFLMGSILFAIIKSL